MAVLPIDEHSVLYGPLSGDDSGWLTGCDTYYQFLPPPVENGRNEVWQMNDVKRHLCLSCNKHTTCNVFNICRGCKMAICFKCSKKNMLCKKCEKKGWEKVLNNE